MENSMQIVAWLIGVPAVVLALAYGVIFTSMLAAKFRQGHAGFERHAAYPAIRDLRSVASRGLDARARKSPAATVAAR